MHLTIFTVIQFAIAISFPIQIMVLYQYGPSNPAQIFSKLTYLNWIVMFLCTSVGIMSFRGENKIYYLLPISLIAMFTNNFYVSKYSEFYHDTHFYMGNILFLMAHSLLLGKEALGVLKNPEMRWWRHAQRLMLETPVIIKDQLGKMAYAESFNISQSGIFIKDNISKEQDFYFSKDNMYELNLPMGNVFSQLNLKACIVRTTGGTGEYPPGWGMRFDKLQLSSKIKLSLFMLTRNLIK